jgi:hypothetical protein
MISGSEHPQAWAHLQVVTARPEVAPGPLATCYPFSGEHGVGGRRHSGDERSGIGAVVTARRGRGGGAAGGGRRKRSGA